MGGWGGGVESSRSSEEKKRQIHGHQTTSGCMEQKRWSVFSETNGLFCPGGNKGVERWLSPGPPPTPPTPLRSRRGRTRPMKGSGGQISPVETAPSVTTATLVHSATAGPNNMSATHLRGNLPHYGCDYFQITNHSNGESVCIGSSSALQALAEKAL